MIQDKIVFSAKGRVPELLLRDANLDLPKAIDICCAYEPNTQQLKEMNDAKSIDKVDKVKSQTVKGYKSKYQVVKSAKPVLSKNQQDFVHNCNFCGGSHERCKQIVCMM